MSDYIDEGESNQKAQQLSALPLGGIRSLCYRLATPKTVARASAASLLLSRSWIGATSGAQALTSPTITRGNR
jgi:hypothetical protein